MKLNGSQKSFINVEEIQTIESSLTNYLKLVPIQIIFWDEHIIRPVSRRILNGLSQPYTIKKRKKDFFEGESPESNEHLKRDGFVLSRSMELSRRQCQSRQPAMRAVWRCFDLDNVPVIMSPIVFSLKTLSPDA